ncbi:MAG: AI-2E family transporter [Rivularia sp. (in: Bacteria)]|nr:AI-2E family transporter [Rivularia sp. MS3]
MRFGKLIGFLLFAVALYTLWQIRQVLLLGFTAVAFATVINRFVKIIQSRLHLKRGIAVAISVILILSAFVGIAAIVVPSIVNKIPQSTNLVNKGFEQLRYGYAWLQNIIPGQLLTDIGNIQDVGQKLLKSDSNWFGGFFKVFSNSLDFVLNLLLVIVVTIMLLANPSAYRQVFLLLFPGFYRSRADEILTQCEQSLIGWFIGIIFNMTVITVLSFLGLLLLGVPLHFINALLAGFLTFIPNLGPTLSVIPPAIMALTVAPWKALAVIVLYIVIQQTESNILTPLVMKHEVSLLPAITLLSQVAFAVFFGLLGLFLALPLIVVIQVWLRELLIKDILNDWRPHNHKMSVNNS